MLKAQAKTTISTTCIISFVSLLSFQTLQGGSSNSRSTATSTSSQQAAATLSHPPKPVSTSPRSSDVLQCPPLDSVYARPSGPCLAPLNKEILLSSPPHLLADERYMQTKLRSIAPSEEENAVSFQVKEACGLIEKFTSLV